MLTPNQHQQGDSTEKAAMLVLCMLANSAYARMSGPLHCQPKLLTPAQDKRSNRIVNLKTRNAVK
jgi:hypothetical protein